MDDVQLNLTKANAYSLLEVLRCSQTMFTELAETAGDKTVAKIYERFAEEARKRRLELEAAIDEVPTLMEPPAFVSARRQILDSLYTVHYPTTRDSNGSYR